MSLFICVEVELDPKDSQDDWEQYNDNCTF
jgi:hypothetical protein